METGTNTHPTIQNQKDKHYSKHSNIHIKCNQEQKNINHLSQYMTGHWFVIQLYVVCMECNINNNNKSNIM